MTEWTRFQEGLAILSYYIPKHKQYLQPEHDAIYVAEDCSRISPMQAADETALENLGFALDGPSRCWAYFS